MNPHSPAESTRNDRDSGRIRVWDPATRLFHWLLVALVIVNVYTGLTGGLNEMKYHVLSGQAILALVLFRLAWGFVGSRRSRFSDFVRGPKAVLAYARGLLGGAYAASIGHNPMGGWSVMAMLASLLVQAVTGLYANDDIFTEGPLARTVTKATSDALTVVHDINSKVLFVLIAIHLMAVFGYLIVKHENLIKPMLTGRKRVPPGLPSDDAPHRSPILAAAVAAAAAVFVWALVTR